VACGFDVNKGNAMMNGQSGTIVAHPKEGHPAFVNKSAGPTLVFTVKFDNGKLLMLGLKNFQPLEDHLQELLVTVQTVLPPPTAEPQLEPQPVMYNGFPHEELPKPWSDHKYRTCTMYFDFGLDMAWDSISQLTNQLYEALPDPPSMGEMQFTWFSKCAGVTLVAPTSYVSRLRQTLSSDSPVFLNGCRALLESPPHTESVDLPLFVDEEGVMPPLLGISLAMAKLRGDHVSHLKFVHSSTQTDFAMPAESSCKLQTAVSMQIGSVINAIPDTLQSASSAFAFEVQHKTDVSSAQVSENMACLLNHLKKYTTAGAIDIQKALPEACAIGIDIVDLRDSKVCAEWLAKLGLPVHQDVVMHAVSSVTWKRIKGGYSRSRSSNMADVVRARWSPAPGRAVGRPLSASPSVLNSDMGSCKGKRTASERKMARSASPRGSSGKHSSQGMSSCGSAISPAQKRAIAFD
jgi:hypothetical protein